MLHKLCCLLMLTAWTGILAHAQFVKEYKISESPEVERVALHFSSYNSLTKVKESTSPAPVYIHGHLLKSTILPEFRSSIAKDVVDVTLVHKNIETDNLGRTITSKLFLSENEENHTWDIQLADDYSYLLDFNLGMGNADFDLSQLSISKMKVKSASADISIHYGALRANQVAMDTLLVTLNMGKVDLQQANFLQSKKVIIEVNYGEISLNFSEGTPVKSQILAAVTGGSLYLKLPPESTPMRIQLKTTPLCRTVLPDYLRAVGEDIFVSKGYVTNHPALLDFVLDVGVGAVTVE